MTGSQQFRTDLDETFMIGTDTYFTSIPSGSNFGVAFEDDLHTGYFYAIGVDQDGVVLDALHIYNVKDVVFRDAPCKINVLWTENEQIAALLINDYCHAIFDFYNKEGFCRNGFPENVGNWVQKSSRKLTDEKILEIFPKKYVL